MVVGRRPTVRHMRTMRTSVPMTVLTLRAALIREQDHADQLPGHIASAVGVLVNMIDRPNNSDPPTPAGIKERGNE